MPIQSINPATGEIIKTYIEDSVEVVTDKLALADETFKSWSKTPVENRVELLRKVAITLEKNLEKYAQIITLEMGKTITEAKAEVKKCASVFVYYADNSSKILANEEFTVDAGAKAYTRLDPLGVILAVMPWNFPFWQVMRFAAPALLAGNTCVLKHASNVPASALELEQIFLDSGLPKGAFQTLLIGSGQVESVINDPRVKAVTLTGSEYAGSQVAATAGKALKKTVLELGGSDPFIVLEDADLDRVLDGAIAGRLINNGQSCIAAKRFIVSQELADEFTSRLVERVKAMRIGDPSLEDTQLAPMVNAAGVEEIQAQIQAAVKSGAKLVYGGDKPAGLDPKLKNGFFINPAILTDVDSNSRVFAEETFGPVFAITTFKDESEAVALANNSDLGLGSSIWTKDIVKAEELAAQIESGSVFINQQVRSDPRLPFGGIKKSGYGRELSYHGLREFVNVKTVFIAGK